MRLVEQLSGWAFRRLSPARLARLRARYLGLRARLRPLLTLVYGRFDTAALRAHLAARIGADFDVLMVHSATNRLVPMYAGTETELLRMLIDLCGPTRTLAMPAFWFGDPKLGGARKTLEARPRFDVRRTPSQMGLLTELFRRTPGVRCSRHPIYRVCALGPLAEALTTGHETAGTPAGRGTPFDLMARHRTLVLGLGKDHEVLTQVHHAEDLLGEDFPVPADPPGRLPILLIDGADEIPFLFGHRSLRGRRDMSRLPRILGRRVLQTWHFHGVPMFLAGAREVTDALIAAAGRGVTIYHR